MKTIMKKIVTIILAVAIAVTSVTGISVQNASAYSVPANMKWWSNDKFGMFIHFGAYSYYGQGEWAMSEQKISKQKYQTEIAANFNPTSFDATEIVKYAKKAGMKYIVITAKHHEGFAMWDTKVESFKDYTGTKTFSLQGYTPFGDTGRDVLKELKDACTKAGLRFGLYYSIVDWNHSSQELGGSLSSTMLSMEDRTNYITDMKAQIKELVDLYDPAVMWFDGDWSYSDKEPTLEKWWTKADGEELYQYMKSLNPDIIVNERVCRGFGLGDFECPERSIPDKGAVPNRPWETCQSMNDAWGYKESLEKAYLPLNYIIGDLAMVASEGGNYLLNIGPKGNGQMTDGSKKILNGVADWMKKNSASIYGVSASPFKKDPAWGTYTRKNKTIYAHVCKWPKKGGLVMKRYQKKKIKKITVMGKSKKLKYKIQGNNVTVTVPKKAPDKNDTVLVVQYK